MCAIEWLKQQHADFEGLDDDEQAAIMHFSLIWSFFEAKVCGKSANANVLAAAAQRWSERQLLTQLTFHSHLDHFCGRYCPAGRIDRRFSMLRLTGCCVPLVEGVLTRRNTGPRDIANALLMIVYRLRNNLFHGEKWEGGRLIDQRGNFRHSIGIMQIAVDLNSR